MNAALQVMFMCACDVKHSGSVSQTHSVADADHDLILNACVCGEPALCGCVCLTVSDAL